MIFSDLRELVFPNWYSRANYLPRIDPNCHKSIFKSVVNCLSYHEVEDIAEEVRPHHAPVVTQRVQVEVPAKIIVKLYCKLGLNGKTQTYYLY